MAVTTRAIAEMTREQVDLRLQELGWKPDAGVKLTLLEKKSVLRELLEKLPAVDLGPASSRTATATSPRKTRKSSSRCAWSSGSISRATRRSRS